MEIPKKYKENSNVSSEGPSSGVTNGSREKYTSFYTKNIKAVFYIKGGLLEGLPNSRI
jgi:hypothetical protein